MRIIARNTSTVTTDTFEIDIQGERFIYVEYLNEKGKVIDTNLRHTDGNEVTDGREANLFGEIQKFLDDQGVQ